MGVRDYPCQVRYLRDPELLRDAELQRAEDRAWMLEARWCIRELQLKVVLLEQELAKRGIVRLGQPGAGQRRDDPRVEDLIGPA